MNNGPSTSGKLIFEKSGPITQITLNRPNVHNALDRELSQELQDAIVAVDNDRECRIMVLTGAGNTFCTGDDIKEFNEWTQEDTEWQVRRYQHTVRLLENLRPVSITKYCVKKGSDIDFTNVMVLEGIPQRLQIKDVMGIKDFVETETRNKRRSLLTDFWYD